MNRQDSTHSQLFDLVERLLGRSYHDVAAWICGSGVRPATAELHEARRMAVRSKSYDADDWLGLRESGEVSGLRWDVGRRNVQVRFDGAARKTLPGAVYAATICIGDDETHHSAVFDLGEGDDVAFDQWVLCTVRPLLWTEERMLFGTGPGKTFRVMEGPKVVGIGRFE